MSAVRTVPCVLVMLPVCLLAVGLWQIGEGSWIYAKAGLAQYLLFRWRFNRLASRLPRAYRVAPVAASEAQR